jgi:hypothetical protein
VLPEHVEIENAYLELESATEVLADSLGVVSLDAGEAAYCSGNHLGKSIIMVGASKSLSLASKGSWLLTLSTRDISEATAIKPRDYLNLEARKLNWEEIQEQGCVPEAQERIQIFSDAVSLHPTSRLAVQGADIPIWSRSFLVGKHKRHRFLCST